MNDIKLETGLKLIIENSNELFKEATLLKDNGYLQRAYTLFQFSIEEVGKGKIIYNSILNYYINGDISEKYLNDLGFKDHKNKTKEALKMEFITILIYEKHIGAKVDGLRNSIIDDFKKVGVINNTKNLSLYVGLEGDEFISPKKSITLDMVEEIQQKALMNIKVLESYLKPLELMKTIADELKVILDSPEKEEEIRKKIKAEFDISL